MKIEDTKLQDILDALNMLYSSVNNDAHDYVGYRKVYDSWGSKDLMEENKAKHPYISH